MEQEELMELPPGFRFHPTDEELITHYLSNKVIDSRFIARAIGEVDLNKCEPWDLPLKAKMGEKQWYFFCLNDRKYPTGLRTNRATESGYWKATGKDKEINRGKSLVGMKKTLVFYRGRAPKGLKTNWVMHEFRLEGNFSAYNLTKSAKNEWVISRVFNKSSNVEKVSSSDELGSNSNAPSSMDVSYTRKNKDYSSVSDSAYVPCFSNAMECQRSHQELFANYYNTPLLATATATTAAAATTAATTATTTATNFSEAIPSSLNINNVSLPSSMYDNLQYPGVSFLQLLESNGYGKADMELVSVSQDTGITSDANPEISSIVSNNDMAGISFDGQEDPTGSSGPLRLVEYLWNY